MSEAVYINLLRTVALIISIIGTLIGLDLLFLRARITTALKRLLDKSFDFDKIADTLNKTYDFDGKVTRPKFNIVAGMMFLILSLTMLLLIKRL